MEDAERDIAFPQHAGLESDVVRVQLVLCSFVVAAGRCLNLIQVVGGRRRIENENIAGRRKSISLEGGLVQDRRLAFHQLTSPFDLAASHLNAAGKEITGESVDIVPGVDQTEVERGKGTCIVDIGSVYLEPRVMRADAKD